MIAVIDRIDNEFVDFSAEKLDGSTYSFEFPREFIPQNKGIKVGSRIKFNFAELPKEIRNKEIEEDDFSGGFVKNPPRKNLVD